MASLTEELAAEEHGNRLLHRWRDAGVFLTINHCLNMADHERVGREASPSAAVLDSQSVKTTERGGRRGHAGKKVKGRKRQVMVDTDGQALVIEPQTASVQNRDGAVPALKLSRRSFPFISKVFADSAYADDRPAMVTVINAEIVRKTPDHVGFAVHPQRWVVKSFFAWISRNRRLWEDSEVAVASLQPQLYKVRQNAAPQIGPIVTRKQLPKWLHPATLHIHKPWTAYYLANDTEEIHQVTLAVVTPTS